MCAPDVLEPDGAHAGALDGAAEGQGDGRRVPPAAVRAGEHEVVFLPRDRKGELGLVLAARYARSWATVRESRWVGRAEPSDFWSSWGRKPFAVARMVCRTVRVRAAKSTSLHRKPRISERRIPVSASTHHRVCNSCSLVLSRKPRSSEGLQVCMPRRRDALTTFRGGGSATGATLRLSSPHRTAPLSALRIIAWMRRTELGRARVLRRADRRLVRA